MKNVRAFFAAHPRFTTGLHVGLAVTPTALFLICVLGFIYMMFTVYETAFAVVLIFSVGAGYVSLFSTWGVWLLSLLLYRFTHAVREKWSDRLRMTLIRFNIFGGFIVFVHLLLLIVWLVKR